MIQANNDFSTMIYDKLSNCKTIKISKKDLIKASSPEVKEMEQAANKIKDKTNPANDVFIKE